jgi:signal transduction histidine kinase/CheY-like chemotaxis protein
MFDVSETAQAPPGAGLDWWRARVLSRLLLTFMVFITLGVGPSMAAAVAARVWPLLAFDVLLIVAMAVLWRHKGLSHTARSRGLLTYVYLLSTVLLGAAGVTGAGFLWMMAYVLLTVILLGRRAVLWAVAIASLTLGVFAVQGHVAPLKPDSIDLRLLWTILGGNTVLLGAVVASALSGVVEGLGATLRQGQALRSKLAQQHEALVHSHRKLQAESARRQESEAARAALRDQLHRAEKQEALGRFSRGIAHDLNNLLQPIVVNGEFLRDSAPTAAARRDAEQLLDSAHHARTLVHQVLGFGRQVRRELEPVDLVDHLRRTAELARTSTGTRATVEVSGPAEPVVVQADRSQLHQLVMNLCTNALQAMGEAGGTLHLQCGAGHPPLGRRDHELELAPPQGGPHPQSAVWLEVRDTGPGIAAADVDHVFEPYFTTRAGAGGTGLGLAIVHGLAQQLGGMLRLSTGAGQGTSFTITLPRGVPEQASAPAPVVAIRPPRAKRARVLVVDDDPQLRKIAQRLLVRAGVEAEVAESGPQALEHIQAAGGGIDLVLSDRRMPRMSGEDLAEHLHRAHPQLPIVLMSGDGTDRSPQELAALGVRQVMLKPFGRAELRTMLSEVLGVEAPARRVSAAG